MIQVLSLRRIVLSRQRVSEKYMADITYKVSEPQYIRLTLEDRAVCLKNLNDPILTSANTELSNSTSDEKIVEELREAGQLSSRLASVFPEVDTRGGNLFFTCSTTHSYDSGFTCTRLTGINDTAFISKWLSENFEIQPGNSLPRMDVYNAYVMASQQDGILHCNQAKFGKILRQHFPDVRTRRIGVRGHSKYHYCGIGIKVSKQQNSKQNLQNNGMSRSSDSGIVEDDAYFLKWMSLSVDQEFAKELLPLLHRSPTVEDLGFSGKDANKFREFLQLYKFHGAKILECIVDADFYKVKDVMWNFWENIPLTTLSLISSQEVIEGIVRCDEALYNAINTIIIPQVLKPMPVGLMQTLNDFVDNMLYWTEDILPLLPLPLRYHKMKACKNFKTSIHRQLHINHLSISAHCTIHSTSIVHCLWKDWQKLDLVDLVAHCLPVLHHDQTELDKTIQNYTTMFGQLLLQCSSMDRYMKFVESVVTENMETIYRQSNSDQKYFNKMAGTFVLHWSYITGQIILQLTTKQVKSLGAFHLLDILFKDYIIHLMERWKLSCVSSL